MYLCMDCMHVGIYGLCMYGLCMYAYITKVLA